ncbi:uncharacterized protein PV07_09729 [Cladophialophora immunda]|uniref:Carbohydrate-binding module family 19 domain-containing protein n=1 Tax=Cladophialophora immunda TaxID=569365 RepID=A0A0D2CKE1_9EURO|nr:uncharacterized protein PV07_09729 [Cladophialophora immunda]KIW23989.1 hypothetical protein PV07_09729 [Cladophialophora immunda]OQV01878.1 hypothetical protein CLAIMM_07168 [Cladophialophora immunda]
MIIYPLILILLPSATRFTTAYPSPDPKYLGQGQCTYAGQIVCASESTFAICDASLTGVIQPLAVGDTRCGDFGGPPPPPPAAAPSSTTPADAQGTLGFMKTIESAIATSSYTPPPAPPKSAVTSPSSPSKKPPKHQTASTPAPHFAGTSLAVVPTSIPTAIATAGGLPPAAPAPPPRDGCNPGKSTCSGGS